MPVSSYGVAQVAANMSVAMTVATEASTGARLLAVFRIRDLKSREERGHTREERGQVATFDITRLKFEGAGP